MKPDNPLLKILACPLDKGPLILDEIRGALYNPRLHRRYPIVDGIPQLLPSSGEPAVEQEHDVLPAELPDSGSS
ncbi:Trm112 family protein [Streptomyces sp. ISL-1]|uniref:Trm112 family protein n=1 Tax=Streptomyces sp. ISL-1 TaxID=2817657 RepID=UPI001BE73059|nr:Trm112 family protein [Streptomyces sp. ISL-1]MBT2388059.1 Trm112 family protein [Streptomyces sp. ISL-1]